MATTPTQVSSIRRRISILQTEILLLQGRCTHRFRVVSQRHSNGEVPRTTTEVICDECDREMIRYSIGPLCPTHAVEMTRAHDEHIKSLVDARNKVLRSQPGYYAAFGWRCPTQGCDQHAILDQWDK